MREVVRPDAPLERHRHARDPQQRSLQRARHGPRIRHVVAEVVPLVDAGDDEVGHGAGSVHLRQRDVHAVGRRAVDLVHAVAQRVHPQRPAQRQRMTDGAGLDVRRDDGDLAERRERRGEDVNAFRVDAVIVGDEDSFHQDVCCVPGGVSKYSSADAATARPAPVRNAACGDTRVQMRPNSRLAARLPIPSAAL